MNAKYPKSEKLKSRKTIDSLFAKGQSVSKFPLRLVYAEDISGDSGPIKMGVSVSKKHFRKAADRNYFKRVLRESYRLNKQLLIGNLDKPYAFMLLYQTREKLPFEEINSKTILLFEKFAAALKEKQ